MLLRINPYDNTILLGTFDNREPSPDDCDFCANFSFDELNERIMIAAIQDITATYNLAVRRSPAAGINGFMN